MPQFIVHSTYALSWPTHDFRLRKGENRFASREALKPEVLAKLEYLSKSKKTRDGIRIPAAIRFYDAAPGSESDEDEVIKEVDITSEGLSKLNMKELQALADKLGVDHKGMSAKQQLRDAILSHEGGIESDEDDDVDLEDDEDSDD